MIATRGLGRNTANGQHGNIVFGGYGTNLTILIEAGKILVRLVRLGVDVSISSLNRLIRTAPVSATMSISSRQITSSLRPDIEVAGSSKVVADSNVKGGIGLLKRALSAIKRSDSKVKDKKRAIINSKGSGNDIDSGE